MGEGGLRTTGHQAKKLLRPHLNVKAAFMTIREVRGIYVGPCHWVLLFLALTKTISEPTKEELPGFSVARASRPHVS